MPSDHHRHRLMQLPAGTGELLDAIEDAENAGLGGLVDECLTLRELALVDQSPPKRSTWVKAYEVVYCEQG